MDEKALFDWANSLGNIPAAWPLRDAILKLLKKGPEPVQEEDRIADGSGAIIRGLKRIDQLESALKNANQKIHNLTAWQSKWQENGGELEAAQRRTITRVESLHAAIQTLNKEVQELQQKAQKPLARPAARKKPRKR